MVAIQLQVFFGRFGKYVKDTVSEKRSALLLLVAVVTTMNDIGRELDTYNFEHSRNFAGNPWHRLGAYGTGEERQFSDCVDDCPDDTEANLFGELQQTLQERARWQQEQDEPLWDQQQQQQDPPPWQKKQHNAQQQQSQWQQQQQQQRQIQVDRPWQQQRQQQPLQHEPQELAPWQQRQMPVEEDPTWQQQQQQQQQQRQQQLQEQLPWQQQRQIQAQQQQQRQLSDEQYLHQLQQNQQMQQLQQLHPSQHNHLQEQYDPHIGAPQDYFNAHTNFSPLNRHGFINRKPNHYFRSPSDPSEYRARRDRKRMRQLCACSPLARIFLLNVVVAVGLTVLVMGGVAISISRWIIIDVHPPPQGVITSSWNSTTGNNTLSPNDLATLLKSSTILTKAANRAKNSTVERKAAPVTVNDNTGTTETSTLKGTSAM